MEIKINFPEEDNVNNGQDMTPITPCSTGEGNGGVTDHEILSDDEELPTLPTNSPSPDSNYKIFGNTLNVNNK